MRFRLSLAILFLVAGVVPAQQARLLRFPAIHDKQIVFTYSGDLYTVASEGGIARRLTSHDGFEMFPRFSPDGKWIAFTGQYDGNTEVYLMAAEGGKPKRLTYTATLGRDDVSDRMGPNNLVIGWKNDGKHIIIRSRMRSFNDFIGQLYLVPIDGGLPEPLPLPRGGFCSYSPDDKKLVYNRVFREFRTWKRYRGGMADDLWIYDFDTKKTENLVKNDAQDIIPMWDGDKIYFISDRDDNQRMNLFVYNLEDKSTKQLTEFKDFDIKFPSLGKGGIVFENGGWIYHHDTKTSKTTKVPIRILEDESAGRETLLDVGKHVTNFEIAPDGKRALFGARGGVFTVPSETGPTRNLTKTPGVHERNSKWSPDGKHIAFISDASGEEEVYLVSQDGKGKPEPITSGGDTYKYELSWSPDSKKVLWSDRKQRLQYVEVATKKVTKVDQATAFEIRQFAWSPDSQWIAFARPEEETMNNVYVFSLEQGKKFAVTDGWFSCSSPCFSGDGKYLFFVSNRDFNPIYSATEWNHAYQDTARIYFITLTKDVPNPFKLKSDETASTAEKPKADEPKKDPKGPTPVKIDLDGIKDRIMALPIAPSSYSNLQSVGSTVYYNRKGTLASYDLSTQKETSHGSIPGYEISADGKKMLITQDGKYGIVDLPKGPASIGKALSLSGMQMKLDHKAEWKQMFNECWRQMRDFFYDPDMHGVDWKAMRDRYAPLVDHVNHRADLSYIIGEMIGELNCGHTYVGGGEMPTARRVTLGLLGAELTRDKETGYYQIKKILRGANWDKKFRSPLTEIGVNVKEGDWIVAIDGNSTKDLTNIYSALVDTADKALTLKVNSKPAEEGAREVVVTPIADEASLYYYNWVQGNIKKVSEATDGKVGYLHVPDMLTNGLNEFVKHFYPQLSKKALIIDMRGNGGGNVSPMLIERLRRELVQIKIARNTTPQFDPAGAIHGPKVCLMNEFSASDGDLFPFQFKAYKMGKLIGKRSWGGVVGIRGSLPLLDGGYLNKPEFSRFDVEGKEWIIEGHGVDPDIVVDNDPAKEYAGIDEQLKKGIEVILEELKTKEKKLPKVPPYPKR